MKSLTAIGCVVILSSICSVAKSDESAETDAAADYYAQYYKDYYNSLEGSLLNIKKSVINIMFYSK